MVDLPEPVGPTMAKRGAGLGRERRMGERRIAVVGCSGRRTVRSKADARARCGVGSHASRRLGIADGGLGREHLGSGAGRPRRRRAA